MCFEVLIVREVQKPLILVPETVSDLRIIEISAVLRRTKFRISILQPFFHNTNYHAWINRP